MGSGVQLLSGWEVTYLSIYLPTQVTGIPEQMGCSGNMHAMKYLSKWGVPYERGSVHAEQMGISLVLPPPLPPSPVATSGGEGRNYRGRRRG